APDNRPGATYGQQFNRFRGDTAMKKRVHRDVHDAAGRARLAMSGNGAANGTQFTVRATARTTDAAPTPIERRQSLPSCKQMIERRQSRPSCKQTPRRPSSLSSRQCGRCTNGLRYVPRVSHEITKSILFIRPIARSKSRGIDRAQQITRNRCKKEGTTLSFPYWRTRGRV